ncbi:nucleotidyltransferase domain-containing protein [Virgibacillus flavescens]|uniref:nucleotidyltransferase domain-containing protein n=1 Tax=Virgibacillus flavescens TaxID=1611422 RepID=UPI003D342FBE
MTILQTLALLGEELNKTNIKWAVGGSLLLLFENINTSPNDIDLLVAEKDVDQLTEILSRLGEEKQVTSKSPFMTSYFSKYEVDSVGIDVMAGFAICHRNGIYKLPFNRDLVIRYKMVEGVYIPLSFIEDWFILYQLIPGKAYKADQIEYFFRTNGLSYPDRFQSALKQPMPPNVKKRIEKLLL